MKRSSGGSIKVLSIAVFVLGIALTLFLAYQASDLYFSELINKPETGVLVFAVVSIVGVFFSAIAFVCMRGFGEIVEDVSSLEQTVRTLLDKRDGEDQ